MLRPLLALLALTAAAHAADCPRPTNLRFEVTGKIVRSEVGFTQGLEWRDGKLYESTGAIGDHSGLNTIAPEGMGTKLPDDGTRYFGEGLLSSMTSCSSSPGPSTTCSSTTSPASPRAA